MRISIPPNNNNRFSLLNISKNIYFNDDPRLHSWPGIFCIVSQSAALETEILSRQDCRSVALPVLLPLAAHSWVFVWTWGMAIWLIGLMVIMNHSCAELPGRMCPAIRGKEIAGTMVTEFFNYPVVRSHIGVENWGEGCCGPFEKRLPLTKIQCQTMGFYLKFKHVSWCWGEEVKNKRGWLLAPLRMNARWCHDLRELNRSLSDNPSNSLTWAISSSNTILHSSVKVLAVDFRPTRMLLCERSCRLLFGALAVYVSVGYICQEVRI